ncbi:pentapeptide repeat-containing protein [Rothia mucilaginosa]|uniref:pentapeptide repeat-containing protein n=1 Tax=Rothia mucilaginosa TaxID=43675 RepID=UPI00066D8D0F|nr:pentapeptide repeat-containing protein [Rothia mucilaginosa]
MTKPTEGAKESSRHHCWWSKYWFYAVLISLAVIGVPSAFFVPPIIPGLTNDGNTVVSVRQGFLAVLAGALTMLTLSETHRKNTHEKDKNNRDHTRQVYAERRSRYTTAVEQLANEKAAVRLGGIYTLVGLVDEWLADETLEQEEQQKEGQVIINNLCSYIRSPFPLAEEIEEYEARKELEKLQKTESGKLSEEESSRLQILIKRFEDSDEYEKPKDITTDYAKFHEEQDVRRTIFVEMSKRSSVLTKDEKDGVFKTNPGTWSNFDFDFSRAPIFYSLNSLTIERARFSRATFYADSNFDWVTFIRYADFGSSTFTSTANFHWATFNSYADFISATFSSPADFAEATFSSTADFTEATFSRVTFNHATFTNDVSFSRATFTQTANFSRATFSSNSPKFVETSEVLRMTFRARAQFATLSKNQRAHNFAVHEDSRPILLGEAELDGVKHDIPVGTVLFDTTSWDEQKEVYTRVSTPAK